MCTTRNKGLQRRFAISVKKRKDAKCARLVYYVAITLLRTSGILPTFLPSPDISVSERAFYVLLSMWTHKVANLVLRNDRFPYGALFLRYAKPPTFFILRLPAPSRSVFSSPNGIAVYYHQRTKYVKYKFQKN